MAPPCRIKNDLQTKSAKCTRLIEYTKTNLPVNKTRFRIRQRHKKLVAYMSQFNKNDLQI